VSELRSLLRSCRSPRDLMLAAGLEPSEVTSPVIASCLDATVGHPARSKADARAWGAVCRTPWPKERPRRAVACVGRRGLKSSGLLAWRMLFEALCVPHDAHAAAGSRLWFPVVCPRSYQAGESLHAIKVALDLLAPLGVRYDLRDENGSPVARIVDPAGRCEVAIAVFIASEVSVRSFAIPFWAADEAGFFAVDGPSSLRSVARAMTPGGVTFPLAGSMLVSSPGVPEGMFFDAVERPAKEAVVIRGPSWVVNHRVNREACWELAEGDVVVFAQEYEASRFGYSNEGFIDASGLALGDAYTDQGPRPGFFCVALDAAGGEGGDAIGIGCASAFDEEVNPQHAPVRHVVVEHSESLTSSKAEPVSIEAAVGRAVAVSRMFGRAPIVFDQWSGAEIRRLLRERHGYFECEKGDVPSTGQFMQLPMNPGGQTPRFRALRALVNGRRLHLGRRHENLRSQIGRLKATMIASGDLRVEARKHDEVDVLALEIEIVLQMPATAAAGQAVIELVDDGVDFSHQRPGQFALRLPRYEKVWPNGTREPCEIPEWSEAFPDYVADMVRRGMTTDAIIRWQARQPHSADASDLSIRVNH